MATTTLLLAFALFVIIATLYSSVGHAGASGYLAVMSLLSFAPPSIKPTSLVLNIFVGIIATIKFLRAGYFDKKIFLSFIVSSIPMAFLGGYTTIDNKLFKLLAGCFLIISACLLLLRAYVKPAENIKPMPLYWGLILGAMIGLFSGLIGIGGDVFLSPIVILAGWTTVKKASGVASLFILGNSITALIGNITALNKIDFNIVYWICAVVIGGLLGSYLGTKKLNNKLIITFLFLVLLSAGFKFLLVK
jgi:uncharacterized membrane protein YfcA